MRFFWVFIILTLIGCNESEQSLSTKTIPTSEVTKLSIKQNKTEVVPMSDNNVVERLTEFGKNNPETEATIYTSKGVIKVRLFKDTPLHRASFVMMAKSGFYDKNFFTRVVKGFMAQAGGAYSEEHRFYKRKIGEYSIPAEMNQKHFHKRGVLAAARDYDNNPDKRSSPYAFYLVDGSRMSKNSLKRYAEEHNYTYSAEQIDYYISAPGAAHLDGEHTVFGEIVSGQEVVTQLTAVETNHRDWPKKDLFVDSVVVR